MKHEHAEFFTAIANGESLDDWECDRFGKSDWGSAKYYVSDILKYPQNCEVRRKPAIHVVNGFFVPAPLRFAPAKGAVCFAACNYTIDFAYKICWDGGAIDKIHLKRGLIHLTKEAAVANAKAMCGINPGNRDE